MSQIIRQLTTLFYKCFFLYEQKYFSVIAGVLLAANIDKPVMLPRVENGLKNLLHNPSDAFYTGRAMDLLFDGIQIDCTNKEPFSAAICSNLEDQPLQVQRVDENHLQFSLFGNVSEAKFVFN